MERHLRERRLPVQRALTAAVEQRWPASRSGFAFRQRRCHSAAPEYRRLRAEPGPPAPRRRVSGSAPAPRIRLRAEPSRPLPRQHVSCSAPGSVMRPRCPRFAAACARYRRRAGRATPPPRAPGVPPSRPTTCAGRGATADPSAGAVPVRTPGRWSPSRCSGWGPRRAACRAVAPPRERRRPAGRRPGACSCRRPARSARAGVAGAVAEPPTTVRATAPQTDSSRDDSGASDAARSKSDGAATGTGTGTGADAGASAGRFVGGRSCGAGPSSEDGAAGPATGTGSQEGAGNGQALSFNSGRGSCAPACPAPGSCSTEWLATGTTGAFTAAASPEHSPAGGASPGADRGPHSPCSPASPGAAGSPSCLVRPPAQAAYRAQSR